MAEPLDVFGVRLEGSPLGMLGTAAALVAFAMAWVVFRASPTRAVNQRLALVLVVEGLTIGTVNGVMLFFSDTFQAAPVIRVGLAAMLALVPLYVWFLATLPTPMARVLRTRAATAVLVGLALAGALAGLLRMEDFLVIEYDPVTDTGAPFATEWFVRLQYATAIVYVVGLVAAVLARRAADTETARRRASAFAVAFGTRDVLFALNVVYVALVIPLLPPHEEVFNDPASLLFSPDSLLGELVYSYAAPPFIVLVYVPLLAYGILKSQLFDIDLKIKWTVRQSTIGAIFLAAFLAGTSAAGEYLSSEYGFLVGGAGAGLLLFALAPIQRVAERVANRAVPHASGSAEYIAYKKFEVYRAAFEGVLEDGRVNAKERLMLTNLRAKLGLREDDAAALERDVMSERPPVAVAA
ncbi:MAG TPA: hypothetical protein VHH36_09850 [Candidatus Thermoplasmatota archaeon]|nr:hypothetical protein [Candidatus Thermoplasmatota archaeon]